MSRIKNKDFVAEHVAFIRNSVFDLSAKSPGKSHHNIAAHLIKSCIKHEDQEEEPEVNEKEMCPYCYNLWSNGQYQVKTKPKVKRKGKYKVTALVILCFQCNNTVKIHTSKVTRSQIIDNTQIRAEKCLIKNKKKINKIKLIESNQEQLASKSTKKKVKEEGSLIAPKENPNNKKVLDIPQNKISFASKAKEISKAKNNQNNLAQKKNEDKKRLKFLKHLSKSNQTPMKPKSSLESFLNSVNNI